MCIFLSDIDKKLRGTYIPLLIVKGNILKESKNI
jgi:hypothetical protein